MKPHGGLSKAYMFLNLNGVKIIYAYAGYLRWKQPENQMYRILIASCSIGTLCNEGNKSIQHMPNFRKGHLKKN